MKKENIEFLKKLVKTPSPTGEEEKAVEVFADHMKKFATHQFTDYFNNCAFSALSKQSLKDESTRVMISGHLDELSYMISAIEDSGICRIVRCSGEDRRVLPGLKLQVITESGELYPGIASYKPIHVQTDKEYEAIAKVEDIYFDLGCTSKEEVESLGIRIGSRVVYDKGQEMLEYGPSGDFIVAPGLDDKIGVYITSEVLRRVDKDTLRDNNIDLWCVGMAEEETGLRGSRVAARKIDPDISIDIDVCPVTGNEYGVDPSKFGNIKFGKGVVIENGPGKSPRLVKKLIAIAKQYNIPYQLGVCRAGGTNTAKIQENTWNCETTLLSIPNSNMHQPFEFCHWTDVEACIDLLTRYIEDGNL